MAQIFFYDWLNRFDNFIALTLGMKALLFIRHDMENGNEDKGPSLKNVRMDFLVPNTP